MNIITGSKTSLLFGLVVSIASLTLLIQPSMANEGSELIDDSGIVLSTTDSGIQLEFRPNFTIGKVFQMHSLLQNQAFKGKAIIDDSQLSFSITPVR